MQQSTQVSRFKSLLNGYFKESEAREQLWKRNLWVSERFLREETETLIEKGGPHILGILT